MSGQGGPDEIKMLTRLADRVREYRETKGAPPCPIWPEEAHAIRIVLQRVKDAEARLARLVRALETWFASDSHPEYEQDVMDALAAAQPEEESRSKG